jgi:hypothetical protein
MIFCSRKLTSPRRCMGGRIVSKLNNFYRIRQGFCRIPIGRNPTRISSEYGGNTMKSDQIRPDFTGFPSHSDEIRIGFRPIGIRQKPCRIRSVFYERCRIPMKSDTDPTENDRIYKSDWISWVIAY